MDYCVCGHEEQVHQSGYPEAQLLPICFNCIDYSEKDAFHEFKLDNLKYIEQEAKRQGII